MRIILLIAVLLPSVACAAEWVELGKTPEARIMLDKKKIDTLKGNVTAWLQFIYHKEQPGQTITKGKPFDGSINEYYVVCSSRKYQVLQLFMFSKNEKVGFLAATQSEQSGGSQAGECRDAPGGQGVPCRQASRRTQEELAFDCPLSACVAG